MKNVVFLELRKKKKLAHFSFPKTSFFGDRNALFSRVECVLGVASVAILDENQETH